MPDHFHTDAEGDTGVNGNDIAWVYENLLAMRFDSFRSPNLQAKRPELPGADIDIAVDKGAETQAAAR